EVRDDLPFLAINDQAVLEPSAEPRVESDHILAALGEDRAARDVDKLGPPNHVLLGVLVQREELALAGADYVPGPHGDRRRVRQGLEPEHPVHAGEELRLGSPGYDIVRTRVKR